MATLAATAASLVAAAVLPKVYRVDATILPTSSSGSSGASVAEMAASQLGASGLLGMLGVGGGRSSDLISILQSRTMAEHVSKACGLAARFKGGKPPGDVTSQLMGMVKIIPPDPLSQVIDIRVTGSDAGLAVEIANCYVSELKKMLDEIGYDSASRRRHFLAAELDRTGKKLSSAESALAEFEAKNRIASLPETVSADIRALTTTEARALSVQTDLSETQRQIETLHDRVLTLQANPDDVLGLELKQSGLNAGRAALARAETRYQDELVKLPPKAMQLATLKRTVETQNAIFVLLTQQYESAVIDEDRESEDFLPLDHAEVPGYPVAPKKKLIVAGGAFVGLVSGFLAAIWKAGRESRLQGIGVPLETAEA